MIFECGCGHFWDAPAPEPCPNCGVTPPVKSHHLVDDGADADADAVEGHRKRKKSSHHGSGPAPLYTGASSSSSSGFATPLIPVFPCGGVVAMDVMPKIATPVVIAAYPVVLLDRQHRVTYVGSNAPTPTPTAVTLSMLLAGGAGYAGTGTLSVVTGAVDLYSDAACTIPIDPATRAFTAGELTAGFPLYVLATTNAAIRLRLTLAPDADWVISPAADGDLTPVELTLTARPIGSTTRALSVKRRIVNGLWLGVSAVASGWPLRAQIRAHVSNPAPALTQLVLEEGNARVTLHAANVVHAVVDAASQALSAGFPNADTNFWIAGSTLGAGWLCVGLRMPDGTILSNGDCLKLNVVAQNATSAGFEWENERLLPEAFPQWLQRRNYVRPPRAIRDVNANYHVPQGDAEGAPSKALIFQAGGMALVAEVSEALDSYGEFVLGPAYDCATFATQVGELHRLMYAILLHEIVAVQLPADIVDRDDPTVVWRATNDWMSLRSESREGGSGTPQGSFAVPLWMIPYFLEALDVTASGTGARNEAERWADVDADADDLVCGLVAACHYYVNCLGGSLVSDDGDGPKSQIRVMFRTDFCAMYALLTAVPQQQSFARWVALWVANLTTVPGWRAYPAGADYDNPAPACTVADWLATITAPLADGKDALSPPAPYRRHDTNQLIPYAMGKLVCDGTTGNVIAEWRAMGMPNSRAMGMAFGRVGFAQVHEWARRWAIAILLPGNGIGVRPVAPIGVADPYFPYV